MVGFILLIVHYPSDESKAENADTVEKFVLGKCLISCSINSENVLNICGNHRLVGHKSNL
jgi:hypothetical protein